MAEVLTTELPYAEECVAPVCAQRRGKLAAELRPVLQRVGATW
ncbi:hypothetical protein PR003_g1531 [Phytophthora rubi]|uniref:Uncharacterized protein n=1 Tax=Phytophthora rubi TaxID=129364 RepID=A0A6A4G255_9STRA|nr:hypothetical protein PR002_g13705 [Phytophthora rubi]KAE9357954.1 hypothetical protein PR003_g1531 [Phytophthora rubi]